MANAPVFKPIVHFPTISIPQGDGSYLVRPGKPVVYGSEGERVPAAVAAKLLGLSLRRVETLCEEGHLDVQRVGKKGNYRISVESIRALLDDQT